MPIDAVQQIRGVDGRKCWRNWSGGGRRLLGGGQGRIVPAQARQADGASASGLLADDNSFKEFDMRRAPTAPTSAWKSKIPGDGVVTGWGTINGRVVYVFAKDHGVRRLAVGRRTPITKSGHGAADRAPIIGCSTPAARHPGGRRRARYGEVFLRNVLASGVVPQISVIMGPCGRRRLFARHDRLRVHGKGHSYMTGPGVVKTVTNETVTAEELGGARVHTTNRRADPPTNDVETLLQMRRLLDFLPSNNKSSVPNCRPGTAPTAAGHRSIR
jgi:propionyl-CoA carboxylase beta chain